MRPVRSSAFLALSLSVAAVGLTACGGGSDDNGGGGGSSKYADGKTFTLVLATDPGALDPQSSPVSAAVQVAQFAYDALVHVDVKGEVQPQLASKWTVDGNTVTFDIKDGVTCSDGSTFDAQTVADNLTYVGDPKNKSPYLGVYMPVGATAAASGSTVTLTLASPSPFVINGLANLPMVCESGLKDRASLKAGTAGTGPYTLKEAAPGDHYTYAVRKDYAWGPNGAKTSAEGTPATIEVKIVSNETTAANQLISGEANAAQILGPDAKRLSGAQIKAVNTEIVTGEQWYNHAEGRVTNDPAVRMALTQSLDLAELQKVITSGTGGPATGLAILAPAACPGDTVKGNVPATDTSAAAAALESAGYAKGADGVYAKDGKKLSVTFLYDTVLGSGGSAAAELAAKAWKDLGVDVQAKGANTTNLQPILFGSGDWDIAWEPINVSSPDQIVPFYSGPTVKDGGTNFAGIQNADYEASVKTAMGKAGTDGCDDWATAEKALFKAADVVPFANNVTPTFHKGADLEISGWIVPTSIKMLG
ncbi:peptide/nickel transport system substrate-binding protein [Nocardioides terrae]|uniref:Peptide/nickel transport system substrate-binding protein n=1 Tax=Nocardioides terrae TaxID=574651 RepID=A0A1I1NK57_9ACTN|nr:ABC transporter substrate-binding protein [Nocardioides terrae]SFC97927.1 peptide/nickel transport system substrate-binding protein [Nocardioides terrae]